MRWDELGWDEMKCISKHPLNVKLSRVGFGLCGFLTPRGKLGGHTYRFNGRWVSSWCAVGRWMSWRVKIWWLGRAFLKAQNRPGRLRWVLVLRILFLASFSSMLMPILASMVSKVVQTISPVTGDSFGLCWKFFCRVSQEFYFDFGFLFMHAMLIPTLMVSDVVQTISLVRHQWLL